MTDTSAPHVPAAFDHLDRRFFRRLDSLTLGVFDCPHSTPELTPTGPLLARTQDIMTGVLRTDDAARVSEDTYRARVAQAEPSPGDLLYSREGTYFGIAAEVPRGVRVCLGQRMVLIRPNPRQINHQYLKYWLNSPQIAAHIRGFRDGSVAERLNLPTIREIPVFLRPIPEQLAIAAILGSLDDKIEQNRRTSRALEGLARATFKAWFVDFEPVKAKAAGATSFPGMPQSAFAALPDRLTESPLGPVPEGWVVGNLGDVAEQRRSQVAPGGVDGKTPYIGLEHMPRRNITLAEWDTAASVTSSKFSFHRGDILFGKLRPYFHKVGTAPIAGVCSTDIVVLYSKRTEYAAWLLMLVSSDEFIAYTDRSSAGTKMPRTNWRDMAAFAVTQPCSTLASAFEEQAGVALELITASIHESRSLAALRDYLLPRLLSGEVRVRPSREPVNA